MRNKPYMNIRANTVESIKFFRSYHRPFLTIMNQNNAGTMQVEGATKRDPIRPKRAPKTGIVSAITKAVVVRTIQ